MSMLKEFREFALKGNVVDLAVGVIISVERRYETPIWMIGSLEATGN